MKILKHILIVIALLATSLPCSHAFVHHGHDHDAQALCDYTAAACECHSCDQEPCSDSEEIQQECVPGSQATAKPVQTTLLMILPEPLTAFHQIYPPVSDVFASLQTTQLLI